MTAYRFLAHRFGRIKARLPLNGDWLLVTDSAPGGSAAEIVNQYEKPDSILARYATTATPATARLIYERAQSYEGLVGEIVDRTYDKAKVIFSAASFASATSLALGAIFLPPFLAGPVWLRVLGLALGCLLVLHLSRSLVVGAGVMIRERIIRENPAELLDLSGECELAALKAVTAKIFAYSSQTHRHSLERIRRVIIAQHSFRYALIYYFALAVFSISIRVVGGEDGTMLGREELKTLEAEQLDLATAIDHLKREQERMMRGLEDSIRLRQAQLDVLRALEAQIGSKQATEPPTPTVQRR